MLHFNVCFVSSSFNESSNLAELYQRCKASLVRLIPAGERSLFALNFRLVLADNNSTDNTLEVMQSLSSQHDDVSFLLNRANYGPEASAVNALQYSLDSDYIVLLCSDLQDPPELVADMLPILLDNSNVDAVFAVKSSSSGGRRLRFARRTYYKVLRFSSRLRRVPGGFHGFGVYRPETIKEALRLWDSTDFNLRQCLVNACQDAVFFEYHQAARMSGSSSYHRFGYWVEATKSLLSSDATASRFSWAVGFTLLLFICAFTLVFIYIFLSGKLFILGPIHMLSFIVIFGFLVQMFSLALLSRQVESLRMGGFRPKVLFKLLQKHSSSSP